MVKSADRLDRLEARSFEGRYRAASTAAAAREALDLHGPGLFGFLLGVLEDSEEARIIYADVSQRIGREIGWYQGRCSLRAWVYGLGRRELRDRRLRIRCTRELCGTYISEKPAPADLEGAIAAIRVTLSEEDREFLILRVDRGFSWQELAFTSLGVHAPEAALDAEIRALRGRVAEICERIGRIAASARDHGPGDPYAAFRRRQRRGEDHKQS
jgi:DNA-directed RNA polymerase specialized sigma24 family protein